MTPVVLVFAAKVVVSVLLSLLVLVFLRFRQPITGLMQGREGRVITSCFLIFRLIPFVAVYLILNELPRNDVPFFYEKASKALTGQMVYRDFWSFHAPLFSYLIAIPLLIWHNPRVLVLLMILVEALTVWRTFRFYRSRNREAGLLAVLYFMLPGPLTICLLGGQEDIALWLFGLMTMVVAAKSQARTASADSQNAGFAIGLWMAAALLTLKLTFVLIAFPVFFLLDNKTRLRWLRALLLVGVPSLALLYSFMGTLFLMPAQHGELPFAPNLATVLKPFIGTVAIPLKVLNWIGVALTVGLLITVGLRYRKLPYATVFPSVWIITFGLFMIFQPSAMAYYIFLFLITAVFELTPVRPGPRMWLLLAANLLVVVQPFVWVYLGQPYYTSFAALNSPLRVFEYLLEVATVGCVAAYVWLAWKRLENMRPKTIVSSFQSPLTQLL